MEQRAVNVNTVHTVTTAQYLNISVLLQFVQRPTTPMMTMMMTQSLGSCILKQTSNGADFRMPAETFYCLKHWSRYNSTNELLQEGWKWLVVFFMMTVFFFFFFTFIRTHRHKHLMWMYNRQLKHFSRISRLFLHWFPVWKHVDFKIILWVYKALNGLGKLK